MRPIWKHREEKVLARPIGYIAEKGDWRSQMFDSRLACEGYLDRKQITGARIREVGVTPKFEIELRRG